MEWNNPVYKGMCLDCPKCSVIDGIANCNLADKCGRCIYAPDLTIEEQVTCLRDRTERKFILARHQHKSLKILIQLENPEWCPFRDQGKFGLRCRKKYSSFIDECWRRNLKERFLEDAK